MTPEERASDIMRRCWTPYCDLEAAGELGFKGLNTEITSAIRAAVAEKLEEAAKEIETWPVFRRRELADRIRTLGQTEQRIESGSAADQAKEG